jgi:CheY-like chemotaxis protein
VQKVKQRSLEEEKRPCLCEKSRTNYKLVFMDCNMPIMDGFEATVEIRKLFSDEEMFIVALTAYTSEQFQQKAKASGMGEFLNKPVNVEEVRELLQALNLN